MPRPSDGSRSALAASLQVPLRPVFLTVEPRLALPAFGRLGTRPTAAMCSHHLVGQPIMSRRTRSERRVFGEVVARRRPVS